jgi:hypothetical protein
LSLSVSIANGKRSSLFCRIVKDEKKFQYYRHQAEEMANEKAKAVTITIIIGPF